MYATERVRRAWHEPKSERDPSGSPVPGRRKRRPPHVPEAWITRPPRHPCRSILATGDPPPPRATVRPATIVKRRPPPPVIGHPHIVVRVVIGPVAATHVWRKVRPHFGGRRLPHRPVGRVVDPLTVRVERRMKIRERARVSVGVFVVVDADGGLAAVGTGNG